MAEADKSKIQGKIEARFPRRPVVVIMGHIDHGKSTLLDYIRKTNTTDKEAGGITQHISAYETPEATFLDTPGHEAFTSIRERGSRVADIAVVVVSAEDGVKPQTLEAIDWVKKNSMPYLVAINKIDKPNANVNKVKQGLAEKEVLLEGWGGTVPFVEISAKTGAGVQDLLETLALQAELEGFTFDKNALGSGFIIESHRDPRKGISSTIIIKEGSIKKGQVLRSGKAIASVRTLEDFKGSVIEEAGAGTPVKIVGWSEVPEAGSVFKAFNNKEEASSFIEVAASLDEKSDEKVKAEKYLPVIIKADTLGSLEAIMHEIKKIENEKIGVKVISSGIGSISEGEVKTRMSSEEIILVGFNVKVDSSAKDIALRQGIEIKTFNIIYELVDFLREKLEAASPKEEIEEQRGRAKVLKVFSKNKNKQVIGCKVEEGVIEAGLTVKISRRDVEIGEGKIKELQTQKTKTGKVEEGAEFGTLIDSKTEIAPGDKIATYQKVFK